MIVTIDGPAGAGKSTAARQLAARLGFQFLDTGAMYRVVTLVCLRGGVDLRDERAVATVASSVQIRFDEQRVFADDQDVTQEIRTSQVTQESRFIAANTAVRAHLVNLQRRIASGQNIVTEGRDQGTIAFPHAECKLFVTANPYERARRRREELRSKGEDVSLEEILEQQRHRDQRDERREVGALKPAADAIQVDTSQLSPEAMIDVLEQTVRKKLQL